MNTPKPGVGSMFDYMFESLPEPLEEQRENAIHYGEANGDRHG